MVRILPEEVRQPNPDMEAPASAAEEAANSSQPEFIKIKVKTLGQASYDLEVESDVSIVPPLETLRSYDRRQHSKCAFLGSSR